MKIIFSGEKMDFIWCRHLSKENWSHWWVHFSQMSGSFDRPIILNHKGLLLVQRGVWKTYQRSEGGEVRCPPNPILCGPNVSLNEGLMTPVWWLGTNRLYLVVTIRTGSVLQYVLSWICTSGWGVWLHTVYHSLMSSYVRAEFQKTSILPSWIARIFLIFSKNIYLRDFSHLVDRNQTKSTSKMYHLSRKIQYFSNIKAKYEELFEFG